MKEKRNSPLMERAMLQEYLKKDNDGFCILELKNDAPEWCEHALKELIDNNKNGIKG